MMKSDLIETVWVREALPRASSRLHRLVDRAVQAADLAATDVYALGDWMADLSPAAADALGLFATALFLAVGEGSVAIELAEAPIRRRLDDLVPAEELGPWISQSLADLGTLAQIIGDGNTGARPDRHPLLTWKAEGRTFLYYQKHLRAEQDLQARLRGLVARPGRDVDDAAARRALDEVLVQAPLRVGGRAVEADADQLTAVALALVRDLVIISGGPGTGKTSVVLTLLRCLSRLGVAAERIAVAAPTGRAAQRAGDALRAGLASIGPDLPEIDRPLGSLTPVTLHSLLSYAPHRHVFRRHEENAIPADVVVIDEVSMVSVDQMAALTRALAPQTRLILLGDRDQLPSVEAGAVLGQLIGDASAPSLSDEVRGRIERWLPNVRLEPSATGGMRDTVVVLRTNHRSEAGIREAAAAINRQDATIIERLKPMPTSIDRAAWAAAEAAGGCWWWPQTLATAQEIRGQIQAWAAHVYDEPLGDGPSVVFRSAKERSFAERKTTLGGPTFLELVRERMPDGEPGQDWLTRVFRGLDRARLLTLVREGPWGCGPINEAMAMWLRSRSPRVESDWLPGTPVLVTRNDRVRGLSNGDVGVAVMSGDNRPRIAFARHGGFVVLAPESLPSHELGFALTVHKSQGSEFQQALVVLPPSAGRRLLTKELLYTAITRAKSLAVVSATDDAFRTAVSRRIVRESGMAY